MRRGDALTHHISGIGIDGQADDIMKHTLTYSSIKLKESMIAYALAKDGRFDCFKIQ